MNKKSDKESLEQSNFDSLSVYHSMERLLMAKAKEVSAETDPKALENLRFYRELDSKLQTRASLTTAQIHSLNSLFTHFVNHTLAGSLHEVKGVLHLAYYALLNIASTLISKNPEHQKLASSMALNITNLMTNVLKSVRDLLENETRSEFAPGFDKVEWVLLRLFKILTSSTSYGNQLLLFRNRPLDKKYVYGAGQFKFEREVGLVFQMHEKEESKSEQSGLSSLDALLSDFTGSQQQVRNNLRNTIEQHISNLDNLGDLSGQSDQPIQISAVAVQKAFEELCISKTCKQLLQKSRFYVSLFAYFKTKLTRALDVPALWPRLKLNALVNYVTFLSCKLTSEPLAIQEKFKENVTKSVTTASKEFLVFFVNEFSEKALKKAFVENNTDVLEIQGQMSKQLFEMLELAHSHDVDVGEVATMVVEDVFPTIRGGSDQPQSTVIGQCNLVVNSIKLLKSLVLFKLMPLHVKNFIEVVAALLITKKLSDAPSKIRDHPFKQKKKGEKGEDKSKRQFGNKQEPKSAIPAVGSASFGPKIEEVKEKEEVDFSSDEFEWEPVLPSSEEEMGNLKANISTIVLSFLQKNSLRLHFKDIQVPQFKQILTLFNKIQANVPSSMAALNLHSTLRALSFSALSQVCMAVKQPEKIEELLMQLICDNDMMMSAKNFALFKLIDLAKREQRYKFPKLFEKLVTLFKVFFEKKEPIGILQQFFTANASMLLSVLILFRELPRELVLPHAKQIIGEIQSQVEKPDTEIGRWIMFLQLSFSFELAMLEDLAPEDNKTLSAYFDQLVKTSLSQPGFFFTELSKALQPSQPIVPIKKRQFKFLNNIHFPHYSKLATTVSRTTPRVDSLMTEYIKQFTGIVTLKDEADPLANELRKTVDMGQNELHLAIESILDSPLQQILNNGLNQLEYLTSLLLISLKEQKQNDGLLKKVAMKMKELTLYSELKMKKAVEQCESAPEKASRAANFLVHSQFSSKIDKIPSQYLKHAYLGSLLEDTCNELAHDLKARIETIYDLFSGGSSFLVKKERSADLEKLLLALVKMKYMGRNYELTCEVALMQTLCLLAFPPNFTGNFKSLNDFLESEDIEVADNREMLVLAFYEAAHSPTFTFIQFFQFSMHQWLKGISFAKKSIESYSCLKEAHHVSQLLREVREVLLQSEQSTVLLSEWDGVIKNAIKVLEQDILPCKEMVEALAPSPSEEKNILRFIIRGSMKIPNSLDFAQLLDLILVYPPKSKLKIQTTPKKEQQDSNNQQFKEDEVTIEQKSNKSIAMSFSFAKPKTESGAIQVPQSHKPMASKFMAHLKAKDKRPQLVMVEKTTRAHLLQVFFRYVETVRSFKHNKGVMDQLKERVCGLDQFQLKQLIYIISAQEPQLSPPKKVVFQEASKKGGELFKDEEERERFKEFVESLFPREDIVKEDPFVLTLLGSLINIAGFYFQEEDLREDELEDVKQASGDVEENAFDEKRIKALVETKIPELFQTISHLSWAANKEHPQLQEIASTLIETITTNSYSGASKAVMRLILRSEYFKALLSQSSEHSMLPVQEASESEGEISENQLSQIYVSGSEKEKKQEKQGSENPLEGLLAKGFGFIRNKYEGNEGGSGGARWKGGIRKGGLDGLNEKDFKREENPKPGDMCTYAKTKGNYQDQNWYYCQTCGLNGSSGCCSKCVVHCHKGHDVTFSRRSNFFCDCPDNGTCLYFPRGPAFSPVSSDGQPKIPERYKIAMKNYNMEEKDHGGIFSGKNMSSSIFSRGGAAPPHYRSQYEGELRGLMKQRDRLDRNRKELAKIRGERGLQVRGGKRKAQERRSSWKDIPESKLVEQFIKDSEGNVSDDQMPQLMESSSDSEKASLFSYFERFAGGLHREEAPPIVVEEHKQELEENIKKEEDLIQTPLQLQPPQFKSGAADYEPPSDPLKTEQKVDPTPSPFLEILIDQSKDEAVLMSISALLVEALDETRNSVKRESQEQEEEQEEAPSSNETESAVGGVMRSHPKVNQADLKGTGKKYFIATDDKINLKLEQSNPAKQNIVRIMRNRPDFRNNLDYSNTQGFLAIAETDRVSFVKPSSMDQLIEKSSSSLAIDIAHYKTLLQYQTGWPVIGAKLNPLNSNFVLVYGMQRCSVLVVKANGPLFSYDSLDLVQEIEVELEIDAFGGELNLISVEWLPGSQTHILVTTPLFMKVYDLSRDVQQPSHYLTLAQGNFSAVCLIKEAGAQQKYKILAGSEEGMIFSIDIALLQASEPLMDNQFIIVESLGMEGYEIPIGLPVLSLRHFAEHGGLLQVSWQNGENILGLLGARNTILMNIVSVSQPKDNPALKAHNSKIPNMLFQRGPVLSNVTSVYSTSNETVLAGLWKIPDESTGCIVYLKFKGEQIQVQYLIALPDDGNQEHFKPCGVVALNNKAAPTWVSENRIITSFQHSVIGAYSTPSPLVEEVKQEKSKLKHRMEVDQKIAPVIEKAHLPTSVQLHPIVFQSMLSLKDIKSQNVTLSGEISRKWHNNKQAVEQLDNINNSNFLNSNNKEVKIEIQITGGCVLSGFRLGVRVGIHYTLKLLNRNIPIKPDKRYYDVPLCDAEIYYILQTGVSKLEIVFVASEDGRPELQLNMLNVFALRKNDFKLQEKQDLVRKFIQQNNAEKPGAKALELAKKEKERQQAEKEQQRLEELKKKEYFLLYEQLVTKMAQKQHNQGILNISMLIPVYLLSKAQEDSRNKDIYSSALSVMPSSRYIGVNNEAESILAHQFLSFVLKNESPELSQGSLLKNTGAMLQLFKGKKARRLSKKNLLKIREIAERHPADYIILLGEYGPALISLLQYFEQHSISKQSTNKSKIAYLAGDHLSEMLVLVLELITFYINKACHEWCPEITASGILEVHKRILQSGFSETPEIFQLLQIASGILLAKNIKPTGKQEVLSRLLTELHTRASLFQGLFQFEEDLTIHEDIKCQVTKFANTPFRKEGQTDLINFLELQPVSLRYLPFNLNAMLMDALCSSFSPQVGDLSQLSQILQYSYLILKTEEKVLRPETAEFSLYALKPVVRLAESTLSGMRDPAMNNAEAEVLYFLMEFLLMLTTKGKSSSERKKVEKKISKKTLTIEFKALEGGASGDGPSSKEQKKTSNSLNTYLCFMLCSQLVQKCNLAQWGLSTLDTLYNWFEIGKGTLRSTQQDGVPTGVEASKGSQRVGKLLKPDINKGQWGWLQISHDRGIPVSVPSQRLTSDVIASNLETRDQVLVQQVLALLTNVMNFESGVGKLREKMGKDKGAVLEKFLQVVLPYKFIGDDKEFVERMEHILSVMVTHSPCDKVAGKAASLLLLEISEWGHRGKGKQHCQDLIMRSNYALKINHFNHLSALSQNFAKPFSYQQLLFQVASVQQLWKHVLNNPDLWRSFLLAQNNTSLILENFMTQGSQAGEEAIEELLAIIAISLEKSKPLLADARRKKKKSTISRDCSYIEGETGRLNQYLKHLFRHYANKKKPGQMSELGDSLSAGTLVDWARQVMGNYLTKGDRKMRVVASHLLKGVIETLEIQGKDEVSNKPLKRVLKMLLEKFKGASDEGSNSAEMIGLLAWLCLSPHPHFDYIPFIKQVIMLLMNNVKAVSQIIDSHQNLQIYSALHKILGSDAFASQKDPGMEMILEDGMKKEKLQQLMAGGGGKASQDFLYLLENDPCMRCYEEVKPPFQHHSLSSVKSDIKFTDSSHVIQFKEPLVIKTISIDLNSQRGQMALRSVIIYTNNKIGADITQLKTHRGMWTRKRAVDLLETDSGTKIRFPVPVSAANLMIEFQGVPRKDKSAPMGGSMPGDIFLGGGAFCLRCGRQVEDRHGVCLNCGENAYQCPYCRNINYENPTAFLCNECGLSRYTKFDITLTAKAGSAVETLESEEQKKAMEEKIDQINAKMRHDHKSLAGKRQQLQNLVRELEQSNVSLMSDQNEKVVKKGGGNMFNADMDLSQMVKSKFGSSSLALAAGSAGSAASNVASQIGTLYTSDCKVAYQRYMNHWTSLLSLRKEVLKFQNRDMQRKRGGEYIDLFGADEQPEVYFEDIELAGKAVHRTHCFGCNMNFLFIALSFIRQLALSPAVAELMLEAAIVQSLHAKSMRIFSQEHRKLATSALCRMVTRNANSALHLVSTLEGQFALLETGAGGFGVHSPALLAQYLQDDVQLVIKLISVAENELLTKDNIQAEELFERLIKLFWSVLQKAVGLAEYNGAIADRILTPCLDYLLHSLQKEDLLRQAYSVLKGDEQWGAAPKKKLPAAFGIKEMEAMDELAADFQDIEQFGAQMELEGQEINHQILLSDMAAQPPQFQELAVRDPEAAEEVAKQAATEMSEWCKFIKAQTASLTEPAYLTPFEEIKESQNEVTSILEEQNSRGILSMHMWMQGSSEEAKDGALDKVTDDNWLIQCLLLPTSGTVRKLAKSILLSQTANDFYLSRKFMNALSANLQKALLMNDIASEYFDCFHLFVKQSEEELNQDMQKEYVRILEMLLSSVDQELQRLLLESGAGISMMNQLSNFEQTLSSSVNSGYGLNRMIEMTFQLLNVPFVRDHFKQSSFVKNLIKSHLKVKKLASLMKNASISQCQKILEKMFNTLRSEGKSEMSGFIFECMRILSEPTSLSGIDRAESMYLMEEVRKIIDPEKPEPVYLLNLHKAPSQDVYIRGKMTKNPYSSKDFLKESAASQGDEVAKGPLMKHVRDKVCHELEIGADLMELLVDNKIIDLDIPIRLVYEKAWWPALCRKKNPDIQRIPPISEAGPGELMPMVVIFRLTGLDGEATEDRIESLPDDSDELDGDLEKKYELAQVLSKKFEGFDGTESSGIGILLERVKKLEKDMPSKDRYYSESLLKMLELCCRIKVNRQSVIRLGGTKLLIHKLIEMLPRTEGSGSGLSPGKTSSLPSIQVISDLLLLTLENILVEQSEAEVEMKDIEEEKDDTRSVEILTEKLSHYCKPISRMTSLEVRYKKAITRILPYVTFGDPKAIATLLQSFISNLEFTALDMPVSSDPELTKKQFYTESFIDLVQAIPEHYEVFKEVMVRQLGVLELIDAFFKQTILELKGSKHKIKKLTDAVLQPVAQSLTAVLKILLGLCKCSPLFQASLYKLGHIAHIYKLSETQLNTQRELAVWADKLIKLLSTQPAQLKNPKKSMDAGEYQAAAQAALKARKGSATLEVPSHQTFDIATYEYVNSLIEETQARKKKRAAKKRMAALEGMSKPDKVQVNKLFGIQEDLIEEKGLKCIICHEGYSSNQSKNILGIYIYMEHLDIQGQMSSFTNPALSHLPQLEYIIAQRRNKEQLGLPSTGSMLHKGFTTVSYFTCIHSHCHRAAYENDKNLSQPKKEWEGARIRNSHTKCNSLLPVWGTPIPPEEYRKHLDKCFSYIGSQIGATEIMGSGVALFRMRFKMLVHDIRCLLLRFALEESFSFHSKGGGPEHNLNYLPYLMQAAYFTYSQLVNEAAASTGNIEDNQFRELMGGLLSLVEEGTAIAVSKGEEVKSQQQQESKEEALILNGLKTVNIVNSGFYLVISLLFSSEKEWKQELFAWLEVAVNQARNERFLLANSQSSEFIGVKAPVVLKQLSCEEGVTEADHAALKCLRPALVSLVLVDIFKRRFQQVLETTPGLTGEHQNKMKDLLKDHNFEVRPGYHAQVLKVTEQLPKDYKEVTDFSQISHFLKKLEIDNPQQVEKMMLEKLRLKL